MELLLLRGIEVDDLLGHDRPDPDLGDLRLLDLAPDLVVNGGAGLRDRLAAFLENEVLGQDLAQRIGLLVACADEASDLAVRRLDETMLVDLAVGRQ